MDFAVFPRLTAKMQGYHLQDLDELYYMIRTISSRFEESWYADIYKKVGRVPFKVYPGSWGVFRETVTGLIVVFRKLAAHAKPSMEIGVEDGKVKIQAKASFFTQTMLFPLSETYEQEFEGIKMKCLTKWEDGKLKTEANPAEPGKHKAQRFQRERVGDELVQTMWVGDVVCTRVFKDQQ